MSTMIPNPVQLCQSCGRPLAAGTLECDSCHALVHADEMERKAAQARALEANGSLEQAQQQWLSVLPLLPVSSKQAEWIRHHADELKAAVENAQRQKQAGAKGQWAKRLAPLGPVAVVLAKFNSVLAAVFKLKFLFSFAAFIGLYWSLWGKTFGIGFALLILIHEMGHFIEVKRRGLPADMPVFLPGLGAYVRWQAMGVTQETRAAISLAGPLAGFFSAAVCGLIAIKTHDPIWAALARTGAWLNALNLIPLWVLDGAGGMAPLNRMEKAVVMAVSAGLGYATGQGVFYFVAGGTLANILFMSAARPVAQPATSPSYGYAQPAAEAPHGSPMIAAYFVALLTALGAVLYLLPGPGMPR